MVTARWRWQDFDGDIVIEYSEKVMVMVFFRGEYFSGGENFSGGNIFRW